MFINFYLGNNSLMNCKIVFFFNTWRFLLLQPVEKKIALVILFSILSKFEEVTNKSLIKSE